MLFKGKMAIPKSKGKERWTSCSTENLVCVTEPIINLEAHMLQKAPTVKRTITGEVQAFSVNINAEVKYAEINTRGSSPLS